VHRQALLYAADYGWDAGYEALIARILADFVERFDAAKEQAWIAEVDGRIMGSVFLVAGDRPGVAKLRLLYVEPDARGLGLGRRLVASCIDAARDKGYVRLELDQQHIGRCPPHLSDGGVRVGGREAAPQLRP
jgi:GNAT superfamily N-acetyltransferase